MMRGLAYWTGDHSPFSQLLRTLEPFGQDQDSQGYWAAGLSGEYVLITTVLTAVTFLIQMRGRFLTTVLIVQAALTSLMGQRFYVLVSTLMVLSVLSRYRIAIGIRRAALALSAAAFLIVSISSARAIWGRAYLHSDPEKRITALSSGATGVVRDRVGFQDIAADFVYRIDGNAFPAIVYGRLHKGLEPAGLEPLANDLFLAVPQFMNPQKLSTSLETRNEKFYLMVHFLIEEEVDFLPTTLGVVYACFGGILLLAGSILWGVALSWLDIWLASKLTTFTLIASLGLILCAILMEQGLAMYPLEFRGLLVLYILVAIANRLLLWKRSSSVHGPISSRAPNA